MSGVNPVGIGLFPPVSTGGGGGIPATAIAGNQIMAALSVAGGCPWRQWNNRFTDAQIRSWLGGATTLAATLASPGADFAIVPINYSKQAFNAVQYGTPGGTTPNLRFVNSDLGTTAACALTANDNPVANDTIWRINQTNFTNASALQFTGPITMFGQDLQLVQVNVGATWSGGNAANFQEVNIIYTLFSQSLGRFV